MDSPRSDKAQVTQEIYKLRPWYHDFSRLGLKTNFSDVPIGLGQRLRSLIGARQKTSLHHLNQRRKEEYLFPFLARCFKELPPRPTCLDLFCADGYYSCIMRSMRAEARVTGVDRDGAEIRRARTAAKVLGFHEANFVCKDAFSFVQTTDTVYDLILCAGGLYHLVEPYSLLELLRRIAGRFLVVQSVVTLESESADYFVSPAPGWDHGGAGDRF